MIAAYEARGVNVAQAWGMTEMSPIGTHGITMTCAVRGLHARGHEGNSRAVQGGHAHGTRDQRSPHLPNRAPRHEMQREASVSTLPTALVTIVCVHAPGLTQDGAVHGGFRRPPR